MIIKRIGRRKRIMPYDDELAVLKNILNYQIPEVSEDTRFWMIRTKKRLLL